MTTANDMIAQGDVSTEVFDGLEEGEAEERERRRVQ